MAYVAIDTVQLPGSSATYEDYLGWGDDMRWELIDGIAHAMSPAPSLAHQRLIGTLYVQLANFFHGHECEVLLSPLDVRLATKGTPDKEVINVVQPDLVVVCDPDKLDARGVCGSPDWAIEVLSPSSAGRDHVKKLALYEKHGVPHYWLAHPVDRVLTAYSLGQDGHYGRADVATMEGVMPSGVFPGLNIDWDQFQG